MVLLKLLLSFGRTSCESLLFSKIGGPPIAVSLTISTSPWMVKGRLTTFRASVWVFIRKELEDAVKKELELGGKSEFDEFMFKLLIDDAVIEALRTMGH